MFITTGWVLSTIPWFSWVLNSWHNSWVIEAVTLFSGWLPFRHFFNHLCYCVFTPTDLSFSLSSLPASLSFAVFISDYLFFSSQCSIWLFSTVSIFFPIIFVLHFKYPSTYLYSILNDLPTMKLLFCQSQLCLNQDSLALQLCLGYNGVTDPFQNKDWWKFEKVVRVSDTYA